LPRMVLAVHYLIAFPTNEETGWHCVTISFVLIALPCLFHRWFLSNK
jgi:hypothetical protein